MPPTSGPNQSRAVPTSDSQRIASSNETLNAFLGGRTRSWMTGVSSADTNNPRPAPIASSSNSRKRNQMRKASGTEPPTQSEDGLPRDSTTSDQSTGQLPSAGEPSRPSTVLPSPALTDAPSPNVSNQADCTNPDASAHVEGAGPGRPVSDSNMNQGGSIFVANSTTNPKPTTAISPRAENFTPPQTHVTEASTLSVAAGSASNTLAPQPTALPPSLPENQQNNRSAPAEPGARINRRPSAASEHQAKRTRVQDPSVASKDQELCRHWHSAIERRVAQAAQAGLLNETVEKPRYRILMEACQNVDFFYIAFHQALCAWSLNRGSVHGLFHGLVEPRFIDNAFNTVQIILRKNEHMSTAHLQFFANFPTSMVDLSKMFPQTAAAKDIATFLVYFSTYWHTLSQQIQARRYPLLAHELTSILHCPARGLQAMLFTTSRRCLGIQDGPLALTMNAIFEQDREDEAMFAARGETPEALERARGAVATKYRDIILSQQQQQVPSNAAPSPVYGHRNSMTDQYGRQPAAQSPNLSHPTHTAAQSPSLPHFDTLVASTPTGAPRVSSPASVNNYPLPGTGGVQGPRRPNHLYVQTDPQAASPPSIANYQSPLIPQNPLPRSASAGLPQLHSSHGSPMATQTPTLSSNGQPRTPILPPNNPLLQRRSNSIAYPSQSLPGTYGGYLQHPLVNAQSIGQPIQAGPQHVASPVQMMPPQQYQAMNPQQNAQYRASNMQYNMTAAAPPNYVYAAQATGPRHPPYQVPIAPHTPTQQLPTPQPLTYMRPVQQIPESEYPSSPYGQGSLQVGLQHVGLRSPRRVPSHTGRSRYYQYIRRLVYQPVTLEPQTGLRSLPFNVPENHVLKLSRKVEGQGLPYCYYSEGSYRYRLRICMQSDKQEELTEPDWVISATCWPSHIFFDLNRQCLELRRKQHFHKDQPLELTDFLSEGENTLRISFPPVEQNLKPGYKYVMAIEIIETVSHEAASDMIQAMRHDPTVKTKEKIQRRLSPSDSDDIIIEDKTLTISLADPFSASRFVVPVRGADCKHLECFDLETWLQTRPQKPPQKGGGPLQKGAEPSLVDVWKCPICGLDARPSSLWVDDYLAGVRQSLLGSGDLRTKAITVTADGKWSPVLEPDDSDDDSPAPQPNGVVNGNVRKQPTPTAVIEILDDD
ncbi:hypothetical protein NW762_003581 [Fusarium torreyae]|uniref:SP-RING-type domain-containing protein n=1 Tax=Fusarium torreyae TaxID=1237075 RepID=A0A9W8S8S8_9HYPO|nr:hypothetical protein NW762_003581 [Fusarium torreyae]